MESPPIKRALISVSDKFGLAGFARGLADADVEIYSTGGTRRHLESEGIQVCDVAEYTGFPEMMGGRLKTLHPMVHGGILCRHDNPDDMKALAEHGIVTFELVVVNLYPFEATVAREGVTEAEAIEQIDIGGPTMVRAAAKNHAFTTVATSPEQYSSILDQVTAQGATTFELRKRLAGEAFAHTARYDQAIAAFFAGQAAEGAFPATVTVSLTRKAVLRYGENPHQQAALYAKGGSEVANVVSARQLHGKELSYNNLLDLDSALEIVRRFREPAASVIKHNNPCGAATGATLAEALRKGLAGDPVSAFGSVLGLNRVVDAQTAEVLAEPGLFIEAIAAPDFQPEALEILTTRPTWKANVRLLKVGDLGQQPERWVFRCIEGGALMQEADMLPDAEDQWQVVTDPKPTDEQMDDLRFAWAIVRHVKSNAIVLCKDRMLLGAGAGQMSRVDSVEIAVKKAGDRARDSVLGSDAFFPFPDSIERAAAAGVAAVIQPGGSKRDDDVIAACNELVLPMIFTGRRHFKH
ncbi:MAG: bifunctional phosphoribosylaminoimidazolecarboxamide formyltransferase/IMP cyclohydrolase [Planctomycetes bacterium RBG_16_64_12]|nr:MAG: bifunctional phosphoribosylaminoimidazolecarboxamide formyltransferase/IMP cyclohydrolase [Planctomycetes bacterium RBG_16_64_12]